MVSLIHKKKCEVCKRQLTNELNLGKHPMCDDLIPIKSKKIKTISNKNITM